MAPSETQVTASWLHRLTRGQEDEVLQFLARRPLHTVIMSGLIRDNGLESPLNRGSFYGWRNLKGDLLGVALIGHLTLVETRSDVALAAFARLAHAEPLTHTIIGEQRRVERFRAHYFSRKSVPHLLCRELLFEQRYPVEIRESVSGLRLATPEDLRVVAEAHARVAEQESGVNPMKADPRGYLQRCARRSALGRVWVLRNDARLIFKADVVADTPEAVYLEGVYVHQEERGRGYGLRCLAQMNRHLLQRTNSVCLLVNERNQAAQSLYRRAGFRLRGSWETVFLKH
ncbi:MAG TPA: GNAT family N-acetyltransferase [Blastocatellia bacterium]|nr:GNAT family N-acetyltransferase [Blastocatellia bacterium]